MNYETKEFKKLTDVKDSKVSASPSFCLEQIIRKYLRSGVVIKNALIQPLAGKPASKQKKT